MSDINRKIGGHKVGCALSTSCSRKGADTSPPRQAAINNPNVSEEAKDNSRQAIDELESSGETETTRQEGEKNEGNVIGGYKATLKSEVFLTGVLPLLLT